MKKLALFSLSIFSLLASCKPRVYNSDTLEDRPLDGSRDERPRRVPAADGFSLVGRSLKYIRDQPAILAKNTRSSNEIFDEKSPRCSVEMFVYNGDEANFDKKWEHGDSYYVETALVQDLRPRIGAFGQEKGVRTVRLQLARATSGEPDFRIYVRLYESLTDAEYRDGRFTETRTDWATPTAKSVLDETVRLMEQRCAGLFLMPATSVADWPVPAARPATQNTNVLYP